jgi:5-(carboxyamino)imidazole ribonucleotide synthase
MKTIGIAGGGQLGRMLTDAAHALDFRVVILDPTPGSPAAQVADEQIVGDYKDAAMVAELGSKCDVLTYEIESVNETALADLAGRMPVHPTPQTLTIIKDKLRQKQFLRDHAIPVAAFTDMSEVASFSFPYVLKARSGGFDGRGNALVHSAADHAAAAARLGAELYAESFVHFDRELAIVAARTADGDMQIFPLVETVHKDHICHEVFAPADVPSSIAQKAHDVARDVLAAFDGAGVFAIEMFQVADDILVNEIAPRVHNSGHFTIEACNASQFEQHIRAIAGMPLGDSSMSVGAAVMINILGDRTGAAEPKGIEEAELLPGVKVHMYGKMETKPQRKMGHLTAVADTLDEAKKRAHRARELLSI